MGGKMSSNQYHLPPQNIIYYFPDVTEDEDVLNFFPTADDSVRSNPKKEEASRDPSPPPAHKLLPPRSSTDDYDILKKKKKETISDITSPSPPADNLPRSSSSSSTAESSKETISDIPSPSPADDHNLPRSSSSTERNKETISDIPSPSPADHNLPRSSSAADRKETISDIPSPSPADNLPRSSSSAAEKKETISDILSPSPANNLLPRDNNILNNKETPSPADNDLLPRDNILKKKETISDDLSRPRSVGIFSDFGKQARDILNKDYYYNNHNNEEIFFGLGTSSSHADFLFTAYPEGEGLSLGEFSAAAASNNSVEIKTNAELNGFSTHVVSEIVPKALNGFISMKFPDLDGTSKVGIQCLFPPYGTLTTATFTSTTLKNNFSTFHYSGTIGYRHLSIGGDLVISDPNSNSNPCAIKDYSGGIRFMNSDFDATIGFTDKGDTLNASCVHYLDHEMKKSCAVAEFKRNLSTNENTLTIGGKMERNYYKTKTTLLKAKVDNHGKMGVVLQQQLFKDTKIRICGEFDHKDLNKTPMIGLSLIL